jgi:hypothetical protein
MEETTITYNPIDSSNVIASSLPEREPPPHHIKFLQGLKLTFPSRDEDFGKNQAVIVETYTLDKELCIPIVGAAGKESKISFAGKNGIVLRNWFRLRRTGLLIWDCEKDEGSELGIYVPIPIASLNPIGE